MSYLTNTLLLVDDVSSHMDRLENSMIQTEASEAAAATSAVSTSISSKEKLSGESLISSPLSPDSNKS